MLEVRSAALSTCQRALAINPEDPRPLYLRATAVAQAWIAEPDRFAAPEVRRQAVGVLEAALPSEGMPDE